MNQSKAERTFRFSQTFVDLSQNNLFNLLSYNTLKSTVNKNAGHQVKQVYPMSGIADRLLC